MKEAENFFKNTKSGESIELNPLMQVPSFKKELAEKIDKIKVKNDEYVSEIIKITQKDIDNLQKEHNDLFEDVIQLELAKADRDKIREKTNKMEEIMLEISNKKEEMQAMREEFNCW